MMKNHLKKLAMLALLAAMAAACSNGGGTDETPGQADPPAVEEPTPAPEDPAAENPDGEAPADDETPAEEPADDGMSILPAPTVLLVETGEVKEIETQIEGSTEKVNVVEYMLQPYGIKFALRDAMGAPSVEDDQVVFRTQMGDDVATVAVSVKEGVDLETAVAEAALAYADGYEAGELEDLNREWYPYPGKSQHYRKDGYYYGFDVVDVDGALLVIHHSYPFDAGDGMGAVMHEMLASVALEGK